MAKRVCAEPGCPALTASTRCTAHTRARDKARGTPAQRGYGTAHRAERRRWEPLVMAGNVKCWRCGDYIPPGPFDLGHDDQDRSQYRGPEHVSCNRATAGRKPVAMEVFLICGPPCSGKTTYVNERRQPADLVVDYDDIARRLGSPRHHNHEYKYHRRVEATIARALAGIKAGRHERSWVIRALPRAEDRAALALDLGAEVVLLDAPDDVLIARARARGDSPKTIAAIHEWRRQAGPYRISPDA